ncbi:MAG TPA: nucleoside recognition domain-containing protein, partial [Planctomycetaceae bacterium]|nr:nucleoside recognition domain-containing protein [Planctomycetaceae bacterium]
PLARRAEVVEQTARLRSEHESLMTKHLRPRADVTPEELERRIASMPPLLEELNAQLQPLDEGRDELNHLRAQLVERSFLGRLGHLIEPIVKPLGWDWKIGVSTLLSFPARELVITNLGVIYGLGQDVNEEDSRLQQTLREATWPDGRKIYGVPVALSIMVFFSLCAQCAATLMTIRRETNSWRWPLVTFSYMTALAYVAALVTYQIAIRWSW